MEASTGIFKPTNLQLFEFQSHNRRMRSISWISKEDQHGGWKKSQPSWVCIQTLTESFICWLESMSQFPLNAINTEDKAYFFSKWNSPVSPEGASLSIKENNQNTNKRRTRWGFKYLILVNIIVFGLAQAVVFSDTEG